MSTADSSSALPEPSANDRAESSARGALPAADTEIASLADVDIFSRDLPVSERRSVLTYQGASGPLNGQVAPTSDAVATEYALTVYVNDEELATVVCTPDAMDDLVIGFLASEGVIRNLQQVKSITIHPTRGSARVITNHAVNFNQAFYNKRYIASCCGKSRQTFYFYNDAHTAKRVDDHLVLTPAKVLAAVSRMDAEATLFKHTGGVHIASLHLADGTVVSRSDIGRHNALDKLFGYTMRNGVSLSGGFISFSGRLSSEVLLKVAKIGVGVVVARSAPTALALDIAEELNITTVGFVREDRFNVYTHPERIELNTDSSGGQRGARE
ncbi:formate dehydrogenase accessory sulfurtransferase FdhD [Alicyclobacillus curvatus]|jgi:FdhD protein|nr:formate dehydrogenase accessory sulfurtransferase FdhD [Alicyclobacillus curvatus]